MQKIVLPSINETAFSCPHCSVLTTQHWYTLHAIQIEDKSRIPLVIRADQIRETIRNDPEMSQQDSTLLQQLLEKSENGLVFLDDSKKDPYTRRAYNVHLSNCYNCGKFAVWVSDRLLFPSPKAGMRPNPDLPNDIVQDFEEAREIVNASPRGAAAILRLCIQKLCQHLGEKGKNIDDDIASLVKKGLQPLVQKSLDIVRVIGNEAVHPGVMDLKDDRDTALRLFDLVNAISEQMISHPKVVSEMYAQLPESKRKAIETRDKK